MALLSVGLLMVTPILLMAALAVRFAGDSRILNSIDYATITDPAALHRWAGNRLLILPALSLMFGMLSIHRPLLSIVGCGTLALAGLVIVIWILAGSDKFRIGIAPERPHTDYTANNER